MEELANGNIVPTEKEQPSEVDVKDEEKKSEEMIISIIGKIKNNRNRACVQNIHTFINRHGKKMEMERVK